MSNFLEKAKSIQKQTIAHRRYLHGHAEVGFDLPKTTAYVERVLKEYGYTPKRLKKGGVVAELCQNQLGRDEFILLRADMDGLKIKEESGLPFACGRGNMHACGHDFHAAALLSAAKLLKENPPKSPVRFLFQAAEEILKGGAYAVKAGVCDRVKAAFSLHVLSGVDIPAGQIIFSQKGVVAPSADSFEVKLLGKSCHGAMPHQGRDTTVAAGAVLSALLSLVALEIPAGEGLLTVGAFRAGEEANILSGEATIKGSCRAFDEGLRRTIKTRIKEVAKGIAAAYKVRSSVRFGGGCPGLLQDETLLEKAKTAFTKEFEDKILCLPSGQRKMSGSEDFAFISQAVPSLHLSVSAAERGGGLPLHHPRLVFDEAALVSCVAAYTAFAGLWG